MASVANRKGDAMLTVGQGHSRTCTGVTRRDFLRVGGVGLGAWGLSLGGRNAFSAAESAPERSVILLLMVGGPSQLETFDPKPDAPSEIRGPFGSIATRCPGVRISEHLPRLASRFDRVALIRSVSHDAAPIHETGHQLLQTGRLCRAGEEAPHLGSVVARLDPTKRSLPPSVILPRPIASTGVDIPHGQTAGWLGSSFDPFHVAADPAAADYEPRRAGAGSGVPHGRRSAPERASMERLRPGRGARFGPRRLRADDFRPELPAGAPAG